MKSVHDGVKHSCEFCDYMATTKSSLQQHVKSIHEGVKHSCEFCDYKGIMYTTGYMIPVQVRHRVPGPTHSHSHILPFLVSTGAIFWRQPGFNCRQKTVWKQRDKIKLDHLLMIDLHQASYFRFTPSFLF